MDKIAMVKHAEVAGVIGALVQADLVKVASDEHFDALVTAVSGSIDGTDYNLDDVIAKTAEVIAAAESADEEEGVAKEAGEEEVDETAVMAAMGELAMAKMSGEIDDDTFAKEAADLSGMLRGAASKAKDIAAAAAGKAKDVAKGAPDAYVKALKGLKGDKLKATFKLNATRKAAKNISKDPASLTPGLKQLAKGLAAAGGTAAAAAGAGYGAKKLYDKYKK